MDRKTLTAGLLLGILILGGCASSSSSDGSGASSGSAVSVIDLTWGRAGGYDGQSYSRTRDRYRDVVTQIRRYDREYYERYVTPVKNGVPVRPDQQVEFAVVKENVPAKSVTKPAPQRGDDVEFVDRAGNKVRLSDFLGKTVVLVFTRGFPGYVCPMCTTYTAQIKIAYPQFQAAGAEVLLVFPGEESAVSEFVGACQSIAEEADDGPIPFPLLLDPDLKAVSKFHILADLALPATYIFDARGELAWGYEGSNPFDRPAVDQVLREVGNLKSPATR